jgi:hypothetical protein
MISGTVLKLSSYACKNSMKRQFLLQSIKGIYLIKAKLEFKPSPKPFPHDQKEAPKKEKLLSYMNPHSPRAT